MSESIDVPMSEPPTPEARQWAMFCHLSALLGICIPLANIAAPLIMWKMKETESPFIADQGKEAVNFQLNMLIVGVGLAIVAAIPVVNCAVLIAGPCLLIAMLVFAILAGVKANEGVQYRYPYIYRFIK